MKLIFCSEMGVGGYGAYILSETSSEVHKSLAWS